MWFKWSGTMPTKPELETCIAELESLITDLLADRDMQKKRADEWQALAERRQGTISDYRKYLQKELKQTSKPHNTKRKGNKAKTARMFEWYREYRKAGFGNEESRINVASKAIRYRLTKTELTEHQIKRRFDDQYGEDHDTKALAEY
jgi:hypothetical protein